MRDIIIRALLDCKNKGVGDITQIADRVVDFLEIAGQLQGTGGLVQAQGAVSPSIQAPAPKVQFGALVGGLGGGLAVPSPDDILMAQRSAIDTAVDRSRAIPAPAMNFDAPMPKPGQEREYWGDVSDLASYLSPMLPPSIVIRATGMSEDLTLVRQVQMLPGSQEVLGGGSVKISYLPPGMTIGPSMSFNTYQKPPTSAEIEAELNGLKQLAAQTYGRKTVNVQAPPISSYSQSTAMEGGDV